jgi:hypothetical protein
MTAQQLAEIYEREVFRLVSDRDVRLVSSFWEALHESPGTHLAPLWVDLFKVVQAVFISPCVPSGASGCCA